MTTIEEQLNVIDQLLTQYQQQLQDFKNSPTALRQMKQNEIQQKQTELDKNILQMKEIQRQTPLISSEVRSQQKKLLDLFSLLKQDFTASKHQQNTGDNDGTELRQRAVAVNNQYAGQTDELRDMNRKLEEGVMRIKINQEEVIRQDQQLDNVGNKLNHIQAKAETAGNLVNNMRTNDQKGTIILKYAFLVLLVSDILFACIVAIKEIKNSVGNVSFGSLSKAFLPHLQDVDDINGKRKLYVTYWYDWV